MAGHRRGTHGRAGRITRAAARRQRRRQYLVEQLGRACGPVQRLAAAADYARMVLADMDSQAAEAVAAELVKVLVATVDQASRHTTTTWR